MSTANFRTQEKFPLYVKDTADFYYYYCEDCGEAFATLDLPEDAACPFCGEALSTPKYDYFLADEFINSVQDQLDELNSELDFFKITLQDGYYSGLQFYVTLTKAADNAGFDEDCGPKYCDNESCKYYFDACLSVTVRRFEREQRKVLRLLAKLADENGFEQYACTARFSNGECIYTKVTEQTRLYIAAKSVA